MKKLISLLLAAAAFMPLAAYAQMTGNGGQAANTNSGTMPSVTESVVITGRQAADLTSQNPDPYPDNSITGDGLAILGGPAQANAYKTLALLPGVIADTTDPYGLSNTQDVNVRGKSDFFLGNTIDGTQLSGIVGGAPLVDLEDDTRIDVYSGALRADQGLAVQNASGVVDQVLRGPQSSFGSQASASYGSDDFKRFFGRIDSGDLPTGTAIFISGSYAEASKWKGEGDAERANMMIGISQTVGNLDINLYGLYNNQQAYNYDSLTYAQTQNLSANASLDYNTSLTGTPSKDNSYYGFNRQVYDDTVGIAEFTYHLDDHEQLIAKSYYWGDSGEQYSTSGSGVMYWPHDNDNLGVVAEYHGRFGALDVTAGDWFQSQEPDPPPVQQKQFNVNTSGMLVFASWKTLGQFGNDVIDSPFVQVSYDWDSTYITGGVRYLDEASPFMHYYLTSGLPNVSYSDVFSLNPSLDPNGQVASRTYSLLLPNFAVKEDFTSNFTLDVAYGEKYARVDWGPQASNFFSNEAAFTKQSIQLSKLMNGIVPEIDDEIDIEPKYTDGPWTLDFDLFGYKARDKEVLVFDPTVGQSYYTSHETTTGYGLEASVNYKWNENLLLFANATMQSETYDSNVALSATTVNAIQGMQVPNEPEYMVKLGLTYSHNGFSITPMWRDVGARYGLANDTQEVPAYNVFDLYTSYDLGRIGLNGFLASLTIQNVFDEQYIGVISINEDNLASTTYYAGAPRTIAGSISARF